MDELRTDHDSDVKVFGQDPFHQKGVNEKKLINTLASSAYGTSSEAFNFDENRDRPRSSNCFKKRKY